jgi:hypothetical protein
MVLENIIHPNATAKILIGATIIALGFAGKMEVQFVKSDDYVRIATPNIRG